jgi:hypothetical protein
MAALWLTALNVEAPGPWGLLVDGALATACREVGRAPDAHIKFHAMSVASVALQKVLHCWQQAAQQGLIAPAAVQVRWVCCRDKHLGGASACSSSLRYQPASHLPPSSVSARINNRQLPADQLAA